MTKKHAQVPNQPDAVRNAGATFFVAPQAMWADMDGHLWLDIDSECSTNQKGEMVVRVARVTGEYHLTAIPDHNYAFRPLPTPADQFVPVYVDVP